MHPVRSAASLILVLLLACVGCRSRVAGYPRDVYAGGAFTAIPGIGLAAGGGKVIRQTDKYDWAVEGQFVRHFLDDTDLADDGTEPGRMSAARVGLKQVASPGSKQHATFRYGFQFYRATGNPGIVDQAGDYYGAYASIGFETDLSRDWSLGPEISVAVLGGEAFEIVPTFFWNLIRHF